MSLNRSRSNLSKKSKSKSKTRKPNRGMMLNEKTDVSVIEGYKAARTNLMFLGGGEKCPVIAFTSSIPGEGKTTTCINMAITFAQAGFKTLLIDADMRKIQLYHYFSVPAKPGLSEVLAGMEEEVPVHETPYENLKLLTGGTIPPNPAELLMSKKMDEVLERLRGEYEYIFIDTPPVLAVTDAAALAPKVTGMLMMARQDYTKAEDIRQTLEDLNRVGAKVVGILFNGFNAEAHSYKYKGDYHYRYYETYETKR